VNSSRDKVTVLPLRRDAEGGDSRGRSRGSEYDEMFQRVAERLAREITQTEREAREAGELLARLQRRRPAARLRIVREDPRYRTPVVVQGLLARAQDQGSGRPAEAFHWARLGCEILASPLERELPPAVIESLRRACLLEMAGALQGAGKPGWATLCLHIVEADPGFGCDPDEEAKLCVVQARLYRDRRQRSEALRRYSRAIAHYAEINASAAIVRIRREIRKLLGLRSVS
jgi:hypothetical protein